MQGGAEAGTTLGGRYRLDQLMARGGMAEVWQAHDLRLDRSVAIKMPLHLLRDRPEFMERFRREAVAAARLNHPRVVGVYDTGNDPELGGYIVMELVAGRSLKALLAEKSPLPVEEAVTLAAQVAGALDFAHGCGIVHRDVKPANVLVGADGAKVADFGIAKSGPGPRGEDLTQTNLTLGTARYLSPEQVEGNGVDARSDVYSLGIVLYEMLTGSAPFDAENELALALKHVTTPVEPPSRRNSEVPPWLDAVVMKALAKSPDHRFASAGELARHLLDHTAPPAQSAPAVSPGPYPPAGPPGRRLPTGGPIRTPGSGSGSGSEDDTSALVLDDATSALLLADPPSPGPDWARPAEGKTRRPGSAWPAWSPVAAVAGLAVLAAAAIGLASARLGDHGSPASRSATTTPPANSVQLPVAGAHSFNPPPGSGSEHEETVGNLIDGDPGTYWTTEHYANADFGNLKSGVGAFLQLRNPAAVARLVISSPDSGWHFQVYESAGPTAPASLSGWGTSVAHGTVNGLNTSVALSAHRAAYVLLWITSLPASDSLRIGEVSLFS